ncbi:MAG TPA: hypothetical protein VGB63_17985 [Pedobacter sp.]|jgi:hypothetical protein
MKNVFNNFLKPFLVCCCFIFGSTAFAQTYDLYLCNTATATLVPNAASYTTADSIIWKVTNPAGVESFALKTVGTSPNYPIPTNLTTGLYSYTVTVKSAAGCPGDPSTAKTVYKLPVMTVDIANPSVATYCTNATTPSSTIVATAQLDAGAVTSLPSGITLGYSWTHSKDLAAYTNSESVIGTDNAGTALSNTFTMNTTAVGSYRFRVTANYEFGSLVNRSSDNAGCASSSSTVRTVVVAPQPTQPTITIQ